VPRAELAPRQEPLYRTCVGELPGREYLSCTAFATQMPLKSKEVFGSTFEKNS
jgi:hypothetical protein